MVTKLRFLTHHVATHQPCNTHDNPVSSPRVIFLFVCPQVDLTLHGHHHSYQRTCPVIAGKCQGPGPTFAQLSSNSSSSGSNAGYKGRSVRGGSSAVYVDAAAPVHLVIGNAGAELSLNVEPQPPEIWQVCGSSTGRGVSPGGRRVKHDKTCR